MNQNDCNKKIKKKKFLLNTKTQFCNFLVHYFFQLKWSNLMVVCSFASSVWSNLGLVLFNLKFGRVGKFNHRLSFLFFYGYFGLGIPVLL